MGSANSKSARAKAVQRGQKQLPEESTISMPTGGMVMIPPTYRDPTGMPITHDNIELDRETIIRALDHMGQYLEQRGVNATVVIIGGAVNTVYLQDRSSTHDVDFFLSSPTAAENTVIHEAALSAARSERSQGGQISANWFNNSTQLFMGRELQARLVETALQQHDIVHQYEGPKGGIVLYAAPWDYAFCGKLNRLCESEAKAYDIDDAVSYLHQYLLANGRQTVSAREIKQWCRGFRKQVTDDILDQVNISHAMAYGTGPISRS